MPIPAAAPPPAASRPARSWLYRLTFACAAIVAAVSVGFFGIGLGDGSVSSFNIALWLGVLAGIGVILFSSHHLQSHGHARTAVALLSVLAVPGLLYAFFVILFIVSGARWN